MSSKISVGERFPLRISDAHFQSSRESDHGQAVPPQQNFLCVHKITSISTLFINNRQFPLGSRQLAVSNCQFGKPHLPTGSWQLAADKWQLAAQNRQLIMSHLQVPDPRESASHTSLLLAGRPQVLRHPLSLAKGSAPSLGMGWNLICVVRFSIAHTCNLFR